MILTPIRRYGAMILMLLTLVFSSEVLAKTHTTTASQKSHLTKASNKQVSSKQEYSRNSAKSSSLPDLRKYPSGTPRKKAFLRTVMPYITSQSSSYEIISLAKQNGNNLPNEYIQYGFPTPLIYEDDYMTLNESYMSMDNSIEVGSMWALPPSGYDYYFDWGKYDVNELVVITLNLTYNYNGKEKKVSFSRTYKPEFVYSDAADKRIFITGQYKTPYIINTGEYPLGQKANILSTEEELHENDSIMSNIQ